MKVLGINADEQRAFWLVLGAIYHLGAGGATKGKKYQCVIYLLLPFHSGIINNYVLMTKSPWLIFYTLLKKIKLNL